MRFDDRLDTLLMQSAPDNGAKAALWVQIADIVAQGRKTIPAEQLAAAFARLRQWRDDVPLSRRRATAQALADHPASPEMVDLFAHDSPQVAAPLLLKADLDDQDWVRLIPGWPPTSRALVRERRDLPEETCRLLGAYGAMDFALPAQDMVPASQESVIQIRDLVARIEAYRRDHSPAVARPPEPERLECFRFEAGNDAVINWVEGAPRGPLIGISLAEMAEPGGYGVDGQAAGACRQRAQFRDAHLEVAGIGEASGAWLISANPVFNRQDGRFMGYRGAAKRPAPILAVSTRLLGDGLTTDSVRQLVHELRTPLNAIRGFAEMIESRLLGPVAQHYREMAHNIVSDASRLMAVIDDLDCAARLESGDWPVEAMPAQGVDLAETLDAVGRDLRPLSEERGVNIRLVVAPRLPRARVAPLKAHRLIGRLLSAAIELAGQGEELKARLDLTAGGIVFQIDRPWRILGLTPEQIVATAAVGDGADAGDPALGLGFTLRLIDAMAKRAGAALEIGRERFSLVLPSVVSGANESKESG